MGPARTQGEDVAQRKKYQEAGIMGATLESVCITGCTVFSWMYTWERNGCNLGNSIPNTLFPERLSFLELIQLSQLPFGSYLPNVSFSILLLSLCIS